MNKTDILSYIQASPDALTPRHLARAFRLKGSPPRIELKRILRDLEQEGAIVKNAGGAYSVPTGLPEITIIEISDIDIDGDVFARPAEWKIPGEMPRIEVKPSGKGHAAVSVGDRALARLKQREDGVYEASVIRRMDAPQNRVMGLIHMTKRGAVLQPANKKDRNDYDVADAKKAQDGDLVVAELMPGRGLRNKTVRVVEVIGKRNDPKAISLISIHESGISQKFPEAVIRETEGMEVPSTDGREDLRGIPLVTIDGIDAKDFDDAVFAEKTDDGFHLIVAIADVAYYVRTDTPLDREAQRRGNSTYFPDRVVPMLPEALSNDLCSLRPNEPRACLAVHMWIDNDGKLSRYKFVRGLMQSKARLTYEQVQAAKDGIKDASTDALIEPVINPLYEAFLVLDNARRKRGALELDLPERKIVLDDKGNMTGVAKRARLDSHKLIEEFMVLANVAAASALEDKKAPCVYRIHDSPSNERLDSAREFLEGFELTLPKGQSIKPAMLNHVLLEGAKLPYSHLISIVILRCQSQAQYNPENIGHFGLALNRYAHFTSPIRRYADLIVHRSLIKAYDLGPGGIEEGEVARLEEICENISETERTSMEAERSAVDRFTASFLSHHIGAEFQGRINGVTRFGLFVELTETGADGLVPIRSLPNDFYIHDERAHALVGRRSGIVFRMGAQVTVRLMEADGLNGSTILGLVGHENGADIPGMTLKKPPNTNRWERSDRDRNKGGRGKKEYQKHRKKGKKSPKRRG